MRDETGHWEGKETVIEGDKRQIKRRQQEEVKKREGDDQ